jgi:hypothetical protein
MTSELCSKSINLDINEDLWCAGKSTKAFAYLFSTDNFPMASFKLPVV